MFAEADSDVAITLTPGDGGVLQVILDGEKVYDKNEEGKETPHLNRVKEIRAALREKMAAPVAAADD